MTRYLYASSALALIAGMMWTSAVHAQSPSVVAPQTQAAPEDQATSLDDVIVTARKVSENLQDVPVAVTAFSGEALERRNVVNLQDLGRVTPGLTMRAGTSQASAVNMQIRGQYQNEVLAALDPSVGTYVDGYYWARAFGLNADLVDVQSAQVLRGPQGTLFGRNTTGGAIVVQTNDPRLNDLTVIGTAGYGSYNQRSGTLVVNAPIVEDRIAFRFAGNFLQRDGYVSSEPFAYNGVSVPTAAIQAYPLSSSGAASPNAESPRGSVGRDLSERDNYTLRAKLLVKPTEDLTLLFSAERFNFASYAQNYRLAVVDTRAGTLTNREAGLELGATSANAEAAGRAFFASYIPWVQSDDRVSFNEDPYFYTQTSTYTATATLDTSIGTLKLISGIRNAKASNNNDLDGSPIFVLDTAGSQDLDQFSTELQLTGTTFNDRLDYAGGIFYFDESGFDQSTSLSLPLVSTLTTGPAAVNESAVYGVIDTDSKGVYGQGTYHLTDRLSFTGGLRYSIENKGITVFNRTVNRLTQALVSCSLTGANTLSTPQPCQVQRSDEFDAVTYLLGVNYDINENTLLYAKTGKGFRSGGQQQRATGGSGGFVPFDPEFSKEHEIGLKTELFDRRLRVNAAAFLNNVTGLQRSRSIVFTEAGQVRSTTIIGNAGESETYGGELEITAVVTDGLTLQSTAAYIRPKYVDYSTPDGTSGAVFDRRAERFDQVPRWQWSVAANYDRDFGPNRLNLNANYSWQGDTPIRDVNFTYDEAAGTARMVGTNTLYSIDAARAMIEATTQEAGGQLDLRATYTMLDGALNLSAWGRNVTDFRPNVSSLVFNAPIAAVVNQRRDPAMFGVTLTYRYDR